MHGLLQGAPEEHLSLYILSFQNFYGGIWLSGHTVIWNGRKKSVWNMERLKYGMERKI